MIDEKNFKKAKEIFDSFEAERESQIRISRDITKLSKQLIYALHRDDAQQADKLYREITQKQKEIVRDARKDPFLLSQGSMKIAVQEYVEAIGYYEFMKAKRLPGYTEDLISVDYYLSGLCDLVGELVRKATYSSINKDYSMVLKIRDAVEEIYEKMLRLDFRNSELRRQFDGIKYEMKKVNDLILELQLKGKIS
ncbi:hypothetical protein HY638_03710 [Candidatus Woesearchaeota archaeon]|nr:hypothetical protein [Candidatus Woesearchaeota archaeon]